MTKVLLIFFSVGLPLLVSAQEQPKGETAIPDAESYSKVVHLDEIYERVEIEPLFANGEIQLEEWLRQNILKARKVNPKLPKATIKTKLIIEKDGSLGRLTFLEKPKKRLRAETINLLIGMPKWRPAQQNGRAVRAYATITFEW